MDILSKFSETLAELMNIQSLTATSLARILSIDRSSISKYLRKEVLPTLNYAVKIADYFCCSLDYLLGMTDFYEKREYIKCLAFCDAFKNILIERKCSRYRLCKALGFSDQSVDDWYHGKHIPSLDSLVAISNYFDVSVDELIGRKPA